MYALKGRGLYCRTSPPQIPKIHTMPIPRDLYMVIHGFLYRPASDHTLFSVHAVTGKPMSWHDNQSEAADESYLQIIHHAALEPTKKYTAPQTTSQEIGWITKPLIDTDRTDQRLHHYRQHTEITAYMEQAWRMKEQSVNLQ
uniref:Uncharacterized protein n=1 Tax=Leptobrachium leishanense TaxID=445787 RepID=A0A8C5QKP3_9ANUR